ncbi:MAG: hypothetical protein AAB534_01080 [Patescibacteria group bacterium]
MPKVTFETIPGVYVSIRGEQKEAPPYPVYEDGGLVNRFTSFQLKEGVFRVSGTSGSSGPGYYRGFFSAENAKRIEAWLVEQGAERKE